MKGKKVKEGADAPSRDCGGTARFILAAVEAARRAGTVPAFLLRGPAGVGKTYLTKQISECLGGEYIFFQATLNTSEDDLLYKYVPDISTPAGVRITYGPLPKALQESRARTTVLAIDEFDKTRPSADALLLDYLQSARVSLYLGGEEDVIEGRKENLIVLLTSNDFREFSEPLMRRLITIDMKPLPPEEVERLLRERFSDEKIISVLMSIYRAGLRARLKKPVTLQELAQAGQMMLSAPSVPINEVIYAFVAKDPEDFTSLQEALERLPEGDESSGYEENQSLPDIGEALVKATNGAAANATNAAATSSPSPSTVENVLSAVKVTRPVVEPITTERAAEGEEVTATINNDGFNAYTELIKELKLPPGDAPDVLGHFKVVLDNTVMKIITRKPLSISEARAISKLKDDYEVFVEDYITIPNEHLTDVIFISEALKEGTKIIYYTRKTKILKRDDDLIIRLDLLGGVGVLGEVYKIQVYLKKSDISSKILEYIRYASLTEVVASSVKEIEEFNVVKDGALFFRRWGELYRPEERHVALLRGLLEAMKVAPIGFNIIRKNNSNSDIKVTANGLAVTLEVKDGVPIQEPEDYLRLLEKGAGVKSQ
ncbi:MAG: AAA family ATPase [Conexivisphaera sp.]